MNDVTILLGANESLVAVLSGAITTTNPTWSLIWNGDGGPANPVGNLDGTTEVTLLTGVNTPRFVKSVQIYNADSANITVTISKKIGNTLYPIDKATLSAGTNHTWSVAPAGPQGEEGAVGETGETGATGSAGQNGEGVYTAVVLKAADYSVLAADSGKLFTVQAAGPVVFSLPAPAANLVFTFLNTTNQNMTIANLLGQGIAFGISNANSVAFTTAGQLRGSYVRVSAIDVFNFGTYKWVFTNLGGTTLTGA